MTILSLDFNVKTRGLAARSVPKLASLLISVFQAGSDDKSRAGPYKGPLGCDLRVESNKVFPFLPCSCDLRETRPDIPIIRYGIIRYKIDIESSPVPGRTLNEKGSLFKLIKKLKGITWDEYCKEIGIKIPMGSVKDNLDKTFNLKGTQYFNEPKSSISISQ